MSSIKLPEVFVPFVLNMGSILVKKTQNDLNSLKKIIDLKFLREGTRSFLSVSLNSFL